MTLQTALLLTAILILVDILVIIWVYVAKVISRRRSVRKKALEETLEQQIFDQEVDLESLTPKMLMPIYERLCDSLRIDDQRHEYLMQLLLDSRLPQKYMKGLRSRSYVKRAESANHLKYLIRKDIQEALVNALIQEHNNTVILQLSHALAVQKVSKSIRHIVKKLDGMDAWFAQKLHAVIYSFEKDFLRYAKYRTENSRVYMQKLLCGFSYEFPAEELRECTILRAQSGSRDVKELALKALVKHFPEELLKEPFLSSANRLTMGHVILAYGTFNRKEYIEPILEFSRYTTLHEYIFESLTGMTVQKPDLLIDMLDSFGETSSGKRQQVLARVLSNRVEYFLSRLLTPMGKQVEGLIHALIRSGHTSVMLFFLNQNKDKAVQRKLTALLKKHVRFNSRLKHEMRLYLEPHMLKLFELKPIQRVKQEPAAHTDPPQRLQLILTLTAVLLFFPIVILAWQFPSLMELSRNEIGRLYVVRFNYLLVFYSVTINTIYLIMLGLSVHASKIQSRLWSIKDRHLLFTKNLLPSISIIAPAYNESATIIQSTNSLLNLQYPDYELILVNDGSKDDTLNMLISYYNLEKKDIVVKKRLNTRALRGIYTNKYLPNLVVVDKMNGGKADSLNMGLNIAGNEFFCGIDADSLLEPEALLRTVSVMLDSPHETVAAGGNIFPINGCTVDHGSIEQVSLPQKFLPRLQSLEYIRAFMSGRVGWAFINCLMIISGAFGIFDRELTIRTGGYLTKSGKYHKDTVGEDMELVVRISRYMRERKRPYKVDYAFNGNCWTEVPETWKSLYRQRDRWHRGLVDIVIFHRSLTANPKYGRLGMVGMLYYFLFEFVGPFVEVQGLILVLVSAVIGALNAQIALLLFSSTVLLGVLVSASSVGISQLDREIYSPYDVLRLLWMAVIENIGFRQLISFWRVTAYMNSMKKSSGWGAQVRKGFSSTPTVKS